MDIREYTHFVNSLADEITAIRRDFHKHAESIWTEFRTTAVIAEKLEQLGFAVKLGKSLHSDSRYNLPNEKILDERLARAASEGAPSKYLNAMQGGYTGLVAEIGSGEPVTALRMDIDAMPFAESQEDGYSCYDAGYSSIHAESCHSCGHDAHAAMLLGVAKVISHYKNEIVGTIRLIAQPGEEGVAGGVSMVSAGAVEKVSTIYGAHMDTERAAGTIAFSKGGWAASHKMNVKLSGASAHSGGQPQMGNNCILASANIIQNLYAMPRHSDGYTRVNVGTIEAGTARNSIAPNSFMRIETRAENQKIEDELYDRAKKIIEYSSKTYGCDYNIDIVGLATTADFKDEDIANMRNVLSELDSIIIDPEHHYSTGGCEDYTFFVNEVQKSGGAAGHIRIGCKSKLTGQNYADHSSRFDINEDSLVYGILALGLLLIKSNT